MKKTFYALLFLSLFMLFGQFLQIANIFSGLQSKTTQILMIDDTIKMSERDFGVEISNQTQKVTSKDASVSNESPILQNMQKISPQDSSFAISNEAQNLQKTTSQDASVSNAFIILRKAHENGQISLSYIFPINSQVLLFSGISEKDLNVFKFYLISYVSALSRSLRQKSVDGVQVGDCQHFEDVDGYGFCMTFDDVTAQNRFFGVTEKEGSTPKQSRGLFLKKVQIQTTFPVSSVETAESLKSICILAFDGFCESVEVSPQVQTAFRQKLDESVFVYDFALTTDTLKSENMVFDGEFFHHIFVKTHSQLENDIQISFFAVYVNVVAWYVSALILVVCGMLIFALVHYFKAKKSKK